MNSENSGNCFGIRLHTAALAGQASATRLTFPKNSHIYNCGEEDSHLYVVESGQVKTVTHSREGKRCVLSIYGQNDVFGELCLLSGARAETATAMRRTTLIRIPTIWVTGCQDHGIREAFMTHLTARLSEQQQTIANLVTMDSEKRLAALLLTLGRKFGERRPPETLVIKERITQDELSGMVGTTRSRIGYFLKRFTDAGLVQRGSGAHLWVDERGLAEYVESE
ncbi:Crp/Fnr family transcriptional regulator [Saccharothrix sp. ST-888]|uniref:Crp/Fnr family transcriptional regulator n=1 Tax=Saccharothrix sp. ST-888 TaxID=1427391 RepID=UPI0009E190B7|nr:Crp/Fnr family transcriptional regulator [Saccharothrix sp. ST-888]